MNGEKKGRPKIDKPANSKRLLDLNGAGSRTYS